MPFAIYKTVTAWIALDRRRWGGRPWQRAVGPQRQALLALRWMRDRTPIWRLGADIGVSQATAYRYLHEAIDVIAEHAPTLEEAIQSGLDRGAGYLIVDGTLIPIDRVATRKDDGKHLYYCGKHKKFGVNAAVISDPTGFPVWVSEGSPGSVHDIRAFRQTGTGKGLAPYISRHLADPLVVLTDKGYVGAGVGILNPAKHPKGERVHPDTLTRDQLITSLRAVGERANALLKERWHALDKIHLDPARVGPVVTAALVLTHLEAPARFTETPPPA